MMLLLPRIRDTLGTNEMYAWSVKAIDGWVIEHFGNKLEWVWTDKLNAQFRLVGRLPVYQLQRNGDWFEVHRI